MPLGANNLGLSKWKNQKQEYGHLFNIKNRKSSKQGGQVGV